MYTTKHYCIDHGGFNTDLCPTCAMVPDKKLFPDNTHQNNYEGWLYLGNNGKQDFYYKKSKYACNKSGVWLSIVHSNDPSDYSSPCIDNLTDQLSYYLSDKFPIKEYKTMIRLLVNRDLIKL